MTLELHVNGAPVHVEVDETTPLLIVLREHLDLAGCKPGCGEGECGACTIILDGKAVRSCVTPLSALKPGNRVLTLEGLGSPQNPHPLQKAFIDEQAAQCGYCINGMIMEAAAFLDANKGRKPSSAEIKQVLANNLCRCGTHARIVRAIQRV